MRLPMIALLMSLPAGAAMAQLSEFEVVYGCNDQRQLRVLYMNSDEDSYAVIEEGGHLQLLSRAVTASGARYVSSDNLLELLTKGDEASLTMNAEQPFDLYSDCLAPEQTPAD